MMCWWCVLVLIRVIVVWKVVVMGMGCMCSLLWCVKFLS